MALNQQHHQLVIEKIPHLASDRIMYSDIEVAYRLKAEGKIINNVRPWLENT